MLALEAALFGGAMMCSAFLEWTVEWSPRRGIGFVEGDVTLCAGLVLVLASIGYAKFSPRASALLAISVGAASIAFGATSWFWLDVVGKADPITKRYQFFATPPPIAAGKGWYLAFASSIGAITWLSLRVLGADSLSRWTRKQRRRRLNLNIPRREVGT